jgi:hypothetical protein
MAADADSQTVATLRILRRMLSLRGRDGSGSGAADTAEVSSGKGYGAIDERGGTVTVEGELGPVDAMAYLASTAGRGDQPEEKEYERLLRRAFALTDGDEETPA